MAKHRQVIFGFAPMFFGAVLVPCYANGFSLSTIR